tara:strand:- start:1461 stop:1769 length:309 start_codon:yes stop_codon:yes gene_type:complete
MNEKRKQAKKLNLKTQYNITILNNKFGYKYAIKDQLKELIKDLDDLDQLLLKGLDIGNADLRDEINKICTNRIENLDLLSDLVSELVFKKIELRSKKDHLSS